MRKKFLFVPFVILIVVALDLINRVFCDYCLDNINRNSTLYRNNIFTTIDFKSDVLVIGASKAEHGYNTRMLSDSLNLVVYNAGNDGQNINYQYITLKNALKKGNIKMVILDIARSQIGDDWAKRVYYHKNYYWKNEEVRLYFDKVTPWYEHYFMLSSFYQYNGRFLSMLSSLFENQKDTLMGYHPIPPTTLVNKTQYPDVDTPFIPSNVGKIYLDKIAETCKYNQIELIICWSPCLYNDNPWREYLISYCANADVKFWDYSNYFDRNKCRKYFKDEHHISSIGADIFTTSLYNRIKEEILNSK